MKRYSSYKSTNIPWLKEIPSHWEVKRIGSAFLENKDKNNDFFYKKAMKFFYGTLVDKNEAYDTHDIEETYSKYTVLRERDIVINGLNLNYDFVSQRVAISPKDGIITSAYLAIRPRNLDTAKFFCFLLKAMDSKKLFHGMGTGIRLTLSFDELKKQLLPIPPITEQERIVKYIESKSLKIDDLVQKIENEIQLLEELKQAEIAKAITQGINPDVPMKPTGISWLPYVPSHWSTIKMKYCFNERSQKGFPNEPVLSATQSDGVIPQSLYENRVVVVNKGFDKLKLVKVGDFVISLRSFQGGIEYAYYQGIISAAYTILEPKNKEFAPFYKYLFKSHPFIQLLQTCVTGIREGQNINYPLLSRSFLPIPPIEEQQEIVAYIEENRNKIDSLIKDLQSQKDLLNDYKQRLIADAVTGQINVQNI